MLIGKFRLVIMTDDATEHAIVIWVGVALRTHVPFTIMIAAVDREILIVMVERGRLPSGLGVALCAIRRELGAAVVRVGRGVVVGHMASIALRGRSGVPVRMTLDAVHANM